MNKLHSFIVTFLIVNGVLLISHNVNYYAHYQLHFIYGIELHIEVRAWCMASFVLYTCRT